MEKVKLTQEQADAIEVWKKTSYRLDDFLTYKNMLDESFKCLRGFSLDKFAKALYIGYEVEPNIKVGDFVDIGLFGVSKIAEVTGVKGDAIAINGSDEYHEFKINRVLTDEEKHEEKQRRWWKSHNRDVWELREGDILSMDGYENVTMAVKEVIHENITLLNGEDEEYMFLYDIKNLLSVVCFAEDRKDTEGSEQYGEVG